MKIEIAKSYDDLSNRAADELMKSIPSNKKPLICIASGDSPTGLYKELANRSNAGTLNISDWYFLALDEWIGMNGEDEGSCKYYLEKTFFNPLHIQEEHYCCFDGKTSDTQKECERIEEYIQKHGGIDVAIVGLGVNGHVGLNEPGTDASLHSHVSVIDSVTQQVGQKYFTEQKQLTHGITLGLANLMEAKKVILLVSGEKKAGILKKVIEGEITEQVPATILQQHANCVVYLDNAAAQLLEQQEKVIE